MKKLIFNSEQFSVFFHKGEERHYALSRGVFPWTEFRNPPDEEVNAHLFDDSGNILETPVYKINKRDLEWILSPTV